MNTGGGVKAAASPALPLLLERLFLNSSPYAAYLPHLRSTISGADFWALLANQCRWLSPVFTRFGSPRQSGSENLVYR
jgi:hypothetical protein